MESAASSPKIAAADIDNPVIQQPKKPNSTVINTLFSIAACSSKIDEIKMCQKELENQKQIINENFIFQRKCQQMAYDLEAERKTHAEELRLINQFFFGKLLHP
uniref:Uncharacterized protein n=1 Tax=Panagrolaimus sp. PS1159 TaxID=55785 RepID=A0AC35F5C2_9BILA